MTNEEMVKLYQEGNKKILEQIIESNKGLVHKVANKFNVDDTASIDQEDLVQEGFEGLITAVKKYDFNNEKKAQFTTYAVYWIRQKISRFIVQKNTNGEISLNTPVGDEGAELGDFIKDDTDYFCKVENSVWHNELAEELRAAMKEELSLMERQTLELRYGFDHKGAIPLTQSVKGWGVYTFESVGEILGISKQRATQLENQSMRKLRNSKWCRMKNLERNIEFKKRSAWEDEQGERRIKEREERWK